MHMSTSNRPLILLDFDGTINVEATSRQRARLTFHHGWRQRRVMLDCGFPEAVLWDPRIVSLLRRLARESGAQLAWATMRAAIADDLLSPLLGLGSIPVADVAWPVKAEAVVPWTAGRPFVWFEDLEEECAIADELAAGQPHLMVQVEPYTGITEEDVDRAAEWLEKLP